MFLTLCRNCLHLHAIKLKRQCFSSNTTDTLHRQGSAEASVFHCQFCNQDPAHFSGSISHLVSRLCYKCSTQPRTRILCPCCTTTWSWSEGDSVQHHSGKPLGIALTLQTSLSSCPPLPWLSNKCDLQHSWSSWDLLVKLCAKPPH